MPRKSRRASRAKARSVGRDVTITNIRTAFARDIANALNERLVYPHSRSELETAIQELSLRHNREVYPEQPYDNANIRNNSETRAADGGNNSQAPENGGGRATFMVTSESDADYMDAVEKVATEKKQVQTMLTRLLSSYLT